MSQCQLKDRVLLLVDTSCSVFMIIPHIVNFLCIMESDAVLYKDLISAAV